VRQLPADELMDVLEGAHRFPAGSKRGQLPTAAGASITMKRDSLAAYGYPGGSIWKEGQPT
jgi:hypothetical protein